jgi:hypothetical protein
LLVGIRLVEALVRDIRITTLRQVDDGEERQELDKVMSVMILARFLVINQAGNTWLFRKKLECCCCFDPQGREAQG